MNKTILLLTSFFIYISATAQNGILKGTISETDKITPIPFANILIQGTDKGTSADENGNYEIKNIVAGLYNIEISSLGYDTKVIAEVRILENKPTTLNVYLNSSSEELETLIVESSPFEQKEESPISVKTIGIAEIERNPGANRDISRVLQSLPGVAATPAFRNDIIIRGGGPNENRFFLDGIEVPNINHFATQGASGGPVGLLNVNFIESVDFYSGAFPAKRGNALSSVIEFKQKNGNPDKLGGSLILGSNDFGLTLDGPLGKKADFIVSSRISYLQFLFQLLKLPFLPTYFDSQFKVNVNLDKKNKLTFIGLGAIDLFQLNESVNDGITDSATINRNNYILGNLPINRQWNYAIGMKYTHFSKNGYLNLVLSRNMLDNRAEKYFENDDSDPANLLLDYSSQEIENKIRLEHIINTKKKWRITYGAGYELAKYTNATKQQRVTSIGIIPLDITSNLIFNKYNIFGQVSKKLFKDRLLLSFGLRTDFSDYSENLLNPLTQLSPRFNFSVGLTKGLSLNGNIGLYYQLPPYTVLGFRTNEGDLFNQGNLNYIQCLHYVAGLEYLTPFSSRITVEGFYKDYENYPFMLDQQVSLANLGSGFGVVGNGPANDISIGRSYGAELLYQQKMFKGFFGILAYTLVWSEFTNDDPEIFTPSSWDARHTVSLTFGKKFKKGWEFGAKWRFSSGNPYTPFDVDSSALKEVWDVTQSGVLDYSKVNSIRLSPFHALDIRIDKKWFWKKVNLNLYLDIQNIYLFKAEQPPYLDVIRGADGQPLEDPNDPTRYQVQLIDNTTGTIIPTIGVIFEF